MADVDTLRERLERVYSEQELALPPERASATCPSMPVMISDVSIRGARLSGEALPEQDTFISLQADDLVIKARVAWSIGTACGIEFQEPLNSKYLGNLERRGIRGELSRL